MPSDRAVVYWDSCVFIDRLQETADRIELFRQLTDLAEDKRLLIVTSVMTITEVLRLSEPGSVSQDEIELIHSYFEHEWISLRAVDRPIAEAAAKISVKFGTKAVDAVHLATALSLGVPVMHTYDARLLGHHGLHGTPPLVIREPFHPEASPLLDR